MLNKLAGLFTGSRLFKSSKPSAEQLFLEENNILFHPEQGYIVDGVVVNELSERLSYFSNRKLAQFDDLKALYFAAMIINEKIDLEIASQRFVARLGNTEENLLQLKQIIQKLNDYYRNFLREK
ncbi:hypothetical protein AY606_03515 [Acinetobacter sp. SFB]|uniref:hypothetical protein n=1 Tax=Acinetobacter sp. SFB TaxID=1805634 RepID=UPI0007D8711F|nr:hypothetical protein [Acinetobacter sp. SFB]OAL79734.1 hypothetical protein AY606_03515 [Acinetobacter sp. SFB]